MAMSSWLHKYARMAFGLDVRTLALFRVAIGMMVIGDLWDRSSDLVAHYTDEGVMPRSLVLSHFWNKYYVVVSISDLLP